LLVAVGLTIALIQREGSRTTGPSSQKPFEKDGSHAALNPKPHLGGGSEQRKKPGPSAEPFATTKLSFLAESTPASPKDKADEIRRAVFDAPFAVLEGVFAIGASLRLRPDAQVVPPPLGSAPAHWRASIGTSIHGVEYFERYESTGVHVIELRIDAGKIKARWSGERVDEPTRVDLSFEPVDDDNGDRVGTSTFLGKNYEGEWVQGKSWGIPSPFGSHLVWTSRPKSISPDGQVLIHPRVRPVPLDRDRLAEAFRQRPDGALRSLFGLAPR
jgi:hypothetical protein